MSAESALQLSWEVARAFKAHADQRLAQNPGCTLDAEARALLAQCEKLTIVCQDALRELRRPAEPAPTRRKQELRFSPRARISGGKLHAPVYRYRMKSHRPGEERLWQYIDLPDDESSIDLWNSLGAFEAQPVTADAIRDALEDAFNAGTEEKRYHVRDRCYARLGYRRCSRRRGTP